MYGAVDDASNVVDFREWKSNLLSKDRVTLFYERVKVMSAFYLVSTRSSYRAQENLASLDVMPVESHAPTRRLCANGNLLRSRRTARKLCLRKPQLCRGSPTAPVNSGDPTWSPDITCLRKRDVLRLTCANMTLYFQKLALPTRVLAGESSPVFLDNVRMFRLSYPRGWEQVSKSGAALLLRDPTDKFAQIGVTVTPIKISSLSSYGTLHEIGEKLLKAEETKETSVPGGAVLLSEKERTGMRSGLKFYDFDYQLTTTHGKKRVMSSVVVDSGKLFIMNIQTVGRLNDSVKDPQRANPLTDYVNTFDVGPRAVAQP